MHLAGDCWANRLTTPIAYASCRCEDPFPKAEDADCRNYQYGLCLGWKSYLVASIGPDRVDEFNEAMWMCGPWSRFPVQYDPSNGSTSGGDVWRLSLQGSIDMKK